jgi:hypothetical protein
MPFDQNGTDWSAPDYAWDQVDFFSENDTAALKLVGITGPRIFSTAFQTYGMFSAKMRVSPVVGAVSAFYVSAAGLLAAAGLLLAGRRARGAGGSGLVVATVPPC